MVCRREREGEWVCAPAAWRDRVPNRVFALFHRSRYQLETAFADSRPTLLDQPIGCRHAVAVDPRVRELDVCWARTASVWTARAFVVITVSDFFFVSPFHRSFDQFNLATNCVSCPAIADSSILHEIDCFQTDFCFFPVQLSVFLTFDWRHFRHIVRDFSLSLCQFERHPRNQANKKEKTIRYHLFCHHFLLSFHAFVRISFFSIVTNCVRFLLKRSVRNCIS